MKQESVTADLLQLRAVKEAVTLGAHSVLHAALQGELVATHPHPSQPWNTCWGRTETV